MWLKEGEETPCLALVGSGCLYSYTLDKKGDQTPLQFAEKRWWITDLYAYLTCQKSTQSIKAIETSEILMVTREAQEKLFEAIPKL